MPENPNSSPKSPIRIGFDATWLVAGHKSGVGYYLENLIRNLAVLYPDELLFTGHSFASPAAFEPIHAPNVSYKVSRLLPLKLVNLLRRLHIEIPFEFLIKQRSDFLLFPAYASYPSLFHTPSSVIIYDLAYHDMPETLTPRNQRDLTRNVPRSLRRVSFIITISQWTKQRLEATYKITPPTIITYIPPVLPTVQKDAKTVVTALGITKPYILFVGTLEPRKNLIGLLESYEQLSEALRNQYSLVLAGGDGWKDEDFKKKMTSMQQAEFDVIVTGYVSQEQKQALYRYATLFTLVSFYEGFGMPLLEAMASNVPVLASDIPVFHEVCGTAAAYANPNDPTAITRELTRLLNSTGARNKLVLDGQKNLQRFSWKAIAADVYSQIHKTLGR